MARPGRCEAVLRKSLTAHDGLDNPKISEEGRRFDAGLMCQAAPISRSKMSSGPPALPLCRSITTPTAVLEPGVDEASVINQWVSALRAEAGGSGQGPVRMERKAGRPECD